MTIQYTVFNKNTGRICKIGGCPDEEFNLMPPDNDHEVILGIYFPEIWYVKEVEKDTYQPVMKENMLVSVNDMGVIENVPKGSIFFVNGSKMTIEESTTLLLEKPGVYKVKIIHDHFRDAVVEVEVK